MATEILETTERLTYEVPSDTLDGKSYRFDLLAEGGYGRCACRDWETRRWPNIKAGEPMGTRSTLCKHGIKARRFFLNQILVRLSREESHE